VASVRKGERYEVSEEVGMRKVSLVMVISWLRKGRLEEDQGRGVSLIWARIFEY